MFQAMRNGRAPTQVAPPRGCMRAGPKSGSRPRVAISDLQALVLAATQVGQLDPVRPRGGRGVQVDREVEAGGDAAAEVAGEADALLQRRLAERHERDDVDGADPGMLPGLLLHVDLAEGDRDQPLQRVGHWPGLPRQGEDAAVVGRIARPVEEVRAGHRLQRRGQPVDHLEPAALGHVGHGFDERHGAIVAHR